MARGVATLLFVLQAGAGGAVALAHASDSLAGPATLESQHSPRCVTIHDAARCAQCQYDATRIVAPATRRSTWSDPAGRCFAAPVVSGAAPTWTHTGVAHPRAPPLSLS